jgi:hypothetical protein
VQDACSQKVSKNLKIVCAQVTLTKTSLSAVWTFSPLGVNGKTCDWSISYLACAYGVCGLDPTPCKLAPHCLQGFTGMVMCQPCINIHQNNLEILEVS